MNYFNFKNWLIEENKKDIFGFSKKETKRENPDEIVDSVNPDLLVKQLLKMNLGNKNPKSFFSNEIIWSNETNDKIKLEISPYGSLRATLKRLISDSEGEDTWITKHVHLLPDDYQKINELDFAFKIFDKLKEINKSDVDSNSKKINFENLVIKIGEQVKLKKPCKWMVFDKIKKVKDNYYIIILNMTGSGLESPSGSGASDKIEQYQINITYNEKAGIIRSFGTSITSSKRKSQWKLGISDWDEKFTTSQKIEEITSCIVNSLKSF